MDQMVAVGFDGASGAAHPSDRAKRSALSRAAVFWFVATALGQAIFVAFILAFYCRSVAAGDPARWNTKPLITGYVAGDTGGNLMFGAHVLLAALITAAGLMQLVPAIRNGRPAVHRWIGRVYLTVALAMAVGGLWLVWARGSYVNLTGAVAISLDALLIVAGAAMAWRCARRRQFAAHRRWALFTFVAASAVWTMRIGYMAWGIATGGMGIGDAMDGPFDRAIAFGCYLVPLAILGLYLRAERSGSDRRRRAMATTLVVSGIVILGGSVGAWLVMWQPYL